MFVKVEQYLQKEARRIKIMLNEGQAVKDQTGKERNDTFTKID